MKVWHSSYCLLPDYCLLVTPKSVLYGIGLAFWFYNS